MPAIKGKANGKVVLRRTCASLAWVYATLLALWLLLHGLWGDTVWWLALLNIYAPYLFLPLALLLPIGLFCRRRAFKFALALPVCAFAALYGQLFMPSWPVPLAADAPELAVMTFNIWGYSQSADTAAAVLADGTPDIVALQELSPDMAAVLVEELGNIYPYRAFGQETGNDGLAILSRYPLTSLDTPSLNDADWSVQCVRVQLGVRTVILYNVHLPSSNPLSYLETGMPLAATLEADMRTRAQLCARLLADIETQTYPVLVLGDLNSADQSSVQRLLSHELGDAQREAGWGLGHTFPAYGGSWRGLPILPRQVRIDRVFYSRELVALSARVGSSAGESDHLPVVARLGWRR